MLIPEVQKAGMKLIFHPDVEEFWPWEIQRVQREADRFLGQPACLSLEWAEERMGMWHLSFRIETMREGMAEFQASPAVTCWP